MHVQPSGVKQKVDNAHEERFELLLHSAHAAIDVHVYMMQACEGWMVACVLTHTRF